MPGFGKFLGVGVGVAFKKREKGTPGSDSYKWKIQKQCKCQIAYWNQI